MVVTPMKQAKDHVSKWIKVQMAITGSTQTDCAGVLCMGQSNFSQKLKQGTFEAWELILLADYFKSSLSEVGNLFWKDASNQKGYMYR